MKATQLMQGQNRSTVKDKQVAVSVEAHAFTGRLLPDGISVKAVSFSSSQCFNDT